MEGGEGGGIGQGAPSPDPVTRTLPGVDRLPGSDPQANELLVIVSLVSAVIAVQEEGTVDESLLKPRLSAASRASWDQGEGRGPYKEFCCICSDVRLVSTL